MPQTPPPNPLPAAERGDRTPGSGLPPPLPAGEGAGGRGPADSPADIPRSAQVALAAALVLLLGLLGYRGYGNGLRARPTERLAAAPVDLNTAEVAELEQVPGVGPKRARAIVTARAAAPLDGPDDLRRVPGIGPAVVETVRPHVRAEPDADPPLAERKRPAPAPAAKPAKGGKLQPGDPPVDVNAASEDELQRIPGVGPVTARAIVAARPFAAVDDLRRVKGIGPKVLEKLRPFVTAEPPKP
ncbi:MAG: helix-hairpin-helix domain-containing protein [Gemmataceae bacterium]|nr:helix-hairpin-helix domain-containing protein [Gemmataceae bacterium]